MLRISRSSVAVDLPFVAVASFDSLMARHPRAVAHSCDRDTANRQRLRSGAACPSTRLYQKFCSQAIEFFGADIGVLSSKPSPERRAAVNTEAEIIDAYRARALAGTWPGR